MFEQCCGLMRESLLVQLFRLLVCSCWCMWTSSPAASCFFFSGTSPKSERPMKHCPVSSVFFANMFRSLTQLRKLLNATL